MTRTEVIRLVSAVIITAIITFMWTASAYKDVLAELIKEGKMIMVP